MNNPFKTFASILLLLSFFVFTAPTALAAHSAPSGSSNRFSQCFQKGVTQLVIIEGVQMAIEWAQKLAEEATATGEAIAAEVTNVPTTDPVGTGQEGAIAGVQTASNVWQDDIRPVLDELVYIYAQCAIDEMTANTISWIQGGFHGSPSFALKPGKVFLDLQNTVANQLAKQVIDLRVTDFVPGFSNNLTKSIELSTRVDARGKFSAKIKSTLPTGVEPQKFYNDFNQGGWGAFGASLQTNNNPFGVMIIAGDELAARQLEEATRQKNQLDWANGFIDLVDLDTCTYPEDDGYGGAIVLGSDGQPNPDEYDPSEIADLQRQWCDITTPGNIISDQLSKTLGTDLDRLGLADNMNKIIEALLSKLVQDTVKHVF